YYHANLVSCPVNSSHFSVPAKVPGKARFAGNGRSPCQKAQRGQGSWLAQYSVKTWHKILIYGVLAALLRQILSFFFSTHRTIFHQPAGDSSVL
ncbi:MAG: hypothetical protein KDI29_12190, partial [Pseudomonadales bacterium]|nr:hypothetical protein [Pseudomonadales bacterium]